ncbi:MAG: hypothetical protein ACM35G_07555 [Planctomycetaceae bacterium]
MNDHDTTTKARPIPWDEYQRRALIVGGAGLIVAALSALISARWFFPAYLVAFLFWTGIAVGSLAVLTLHYLVGGAWGFVIRRPLESAVMTLPLMAVLFLPLLLGLHTLYPWSRPGADLGDKLKYLNATWFLVRAAVYFVLWGGLAWAFSRGGRAQDRTEDPAITWRLQTLAAPGLVVVFLSVTFAAVDWGMSIEPKWYSTIYGPMLFVGFVLTALASMILVASRLAEVPPLSGLAKPLAFHDLGNLLLAFTMLWAYMSFSQYLIIWSGNLAEEIPWYLTRSAGLWRGVAAMLIFFHFFLPFFYLLFRENKRDYRRLRLVAVWLLVLHVINDSWLILPAFSSNLLAHWAFVPAFVGVGGLWMATFLRQLKGKPLVPRNDPLLAEVLEHHAGEIHRP